MGRHPEAEATLREIFALPTDGYGFAQISSSLYLAETWAARGEFAEARALLWQLHQHYPETVETSGLLERCYPGLSPADRALVIHANSVRPH